MIVFGHRRVQLIALLVAEPLACQALGFAHRHALLHDAVAQVPPALRVRNLEQRLGVPHRQAPGLHVLLQLARQLERVARLELKALALDEDTRTEKERQIRIQLNDLKVAEKQYSKEYLIHKKALKRN